MRISRCACMRACSCACACECVDVGALAMNEEFGGGCVGLHRATNLPAVHLHRAHRSPCCASAPHPQISLLCICTTPPDLPAVHLHRSHRSPCCASAPRHQISLLCICTAPTDLPAVHLHRATISPCCASALHHQISLLCICTAPPCWASAVRPRCAQEMGQVVLFCCQQCWLASCLLSV